MPAADVNDGKGELRSEDPTSVAPTERPYPVPARPQSIVETLETSLNVPAEQVPEGQSPKEHPDSAVLTWKGVVAATKGVSFLSTGIVGGSAAIVAVDTLAGIDTFQILHDMPALSVLVTAAHCAVITLAASAGIGLSRFREHINESQKIIDLMTEAFDGHHQTLEKIVAQVEPLIAWGKDVSALAMQVQSDAKNNDISVGTPSELQCVETLCRGVSQLCFPFRYFDESSLKTSLDTNILHHLVKLPGRLPAKAEKVEERLVPVVKFLEEMAAHPPVNERQSKFLQDLHDLCYRTAEMLKSIQPDRAASSEPVPSLRLQLNPTVLLGDLKTLSAQAEKWKGLHNQLHESLTRLVSGGGVFEVENLCTKIDQLYSRLKDEGSGSKSEELEKTLEEVREIQGLGLMVQARTSDCKLSSAGDTALEHGVTTLMEISIETDPEEAVESLGKAAKCFERIHSELMAAAPRDNRYARFGNQLSVQIQEFSDKYPNLAVRASVVGLVSAVTYWMACSESLNWITSLGAGPSETPSIATEHLKYTAPFAIWSAMLFAAGVVNHTFRPPIVWASLQLSKWTFGAVAPFAWAYERTHNAGSGVVDFLESKIARIFFRNKQ